MHLLGGTTRDDQQPAAVSVPLNVKQQAQQYVRQRTSSSSLACVMSPRWGPGRREEDRLSISVDLRLARRRLWTGPCHNTS